MRATAPLCLLALLCSHAAQAAEDDLRVVGAPGEWWGKQTTVLPVIAPPPNRVILPTPPPGPAAAPPPAAVPLPPPLTPITEAERRQAAERAVEAQLAGQEANLGIARVPINPNPPAARVAEAPPVDDDPTPLNRRIDTRDQVDFTAYTLDFGQMEIGLQRVGVGIAPRVQLSTQPVLDGLGAWNAQLKINAIRGGPVDISPLVAGYFLFDPGGFQARWWRVGLQASVIATKRWSLHVGGGWDWLGADGIPQYSTLSPFIWTEGQRSQTQSWIDDANAINADLRVRQVLLSMRVATDIRLTWRDSIVLQGSALPYAVATQKATADAYGRQIDLPPVLQLDELLVDTGSAPFAEAVAMTYVASIAYQASWDHLQLRLGVGTSASRLAWLLPTFDLSWRFGGVKPKGPQGPAPATASVPPSN